MLLKKYKINLLIAVTFLLMCLYVGSCNLEPIAIDLENIGPKIIIEGAVTNQPGPYTIQISEKADYLDLAEEIPLVSGADVRISDNEGNSETLVELSPGIYRTVLFQGYPDRTYNLRVFSDGNEYTASSKMPVSVLLDSLVFERRSYVTSEYNMKFYFTDREGREDYYRFLIYRNGILITEDYYLYSDEFSDGEQIEIDYFDQLTFLFHDNVRVEIWAFDRATYQFFSSLKRLLDMENEEEDVEVDIDGVQDEEGNSVAPMLIPMALFNPTSNLSDNAIGYFSAISVWTYNFVVQERTN
ncbi:DUF4249 domain-containing protein [candidate division KSB1 bacterium]